MKAAFFLLLSIQAQARTDESHDEACSASDAQPAPTGAALLQVQAAQQASPCSGRVESDCHEHCKWAGQHCVESPSLLEIQNDAAKTDDGRACSYQLAEDQDGTRLCAHLKGKKYTGGGNAPLNETGYQSIAELCCHHEMSQFVKREIARQGLDVCDLSDRHGFVHWYDCTNDLKTYAKMKAEIAGVMTSACPWLGHLPNCPKKDPVHCGVIAATCHSGDMKGATAMLSQAGYEGVAKRCCHTEMDAFVRREIKRQGFYVCDEGAFKGFLHWFDCSNDDQTYAKLQEGIVIARSGLPPMCPWLGTIGKACPPKGHNCPIVEVPEPAAHRRREACR